MSASIARTEVLTQARAHGLWGRADSPPEWQKTLEGASPGDPILVKDPSDPRDDFYLVPILPMDPASIRSAWIMLDTVTFQLREAALLDHWKFPAFPDEDDAKRISRNALVLPDGTRAQFMAKDLKPNSKNLVWRAGDASILPYWPHKEWIAPHPLTGEPVSVYVTQEGEVLTSLADSSHPAPAGAEPSGKVGSIRWLPALIAGLALGMPLHAWWQDRKPSVASVEPAKTENFKGENERLTKALSEDRVSVTKLEDEIRTLTQQCSEAEADAEQWKGKCEVLTKSNAEAEAITEQWKRKFESLTKRKAESDVLAAEHGRQIEELRKKLAEFLARNPDMKDADPKSAGPIVIPGKTPRPTPVLPREKGPEEIPKP